MPAKSTSCGRLRASGPRRLRLEPGLDFRGLIEIPRRKFTRRLWSRQGASSGRAFGKQERELEHASTVVAGNDVLVAPGADLGPGTMAKLADVDDEMGLTTRFGFRRKAIEPGLEVLIRHRGAAVEPFQLQHAVAQAPQAHPDLVAIQLSTDAGLRCHRTPSSVSVSRVHHPRPRARLPPPLARAG